MSSTRVQQACPATRQHLASREHLESSGLGPAAVARLHTAGGLVRVRRGVYSPVPLPTKGKHLVSGGVPDVGYLAQVRAALLSLGPTAMAGGRTAAALWGFDMLVEPSGLEIVTAQSRKQPKPNGKSSGVSLVRRRGARPVDEPVLGLEPVAVLSPMGTVVDCALTRPLREAVVIVDSALRSGRVSVSELEEAVAGHANHPRAARLARAVALADPESGSVLESALRLLLAQHALHPESQVNLVDVRGRFIGRVDFLFREQRLVLECDGRRWHDPEDARERDRVRANELERTAWRLLRVTWDEVLHRPAHVLDMVRDCLEPWPQVA